METLKSTLFVLASVLIALILQAQAGYLPAEDAGEGAPVSELADGG